MAYDIGPKIGIEGDKEFKNSIKELNTGLKTLGTEMKAVTSAYDRNDKSIMKLRSQNEILAKQYDVQKNKVELLKRAYEESAKTTGENSQQTKKLEQDLNKATAALNKTERELKNNEQAMKNFGAEAYKAAMNSEQMKKAQQELKKAVDAVKIALVAVVGAFSLAAKAAIDYESAFTGVRKVIKATDEELKMLYDGIREMSKVMPQAAADIALIAQNAGQLGIETENILGFTRVMADLGVATNLAGEEAAQSLAKFANITQMSQADFDRLGSTIVDLGNNSATTEKDIAEMGLRLAAAGKQAGMREAEILAFSAALSSVGVEAQAGGTAFSKAFNNINVAVQTGSEKLNDFAKIAGMSSSEFARAFKEDAASAVISFIEGLGNAGERAVVILQEMGITEVRMRDALMRAAGAGDLFRRSIQIGTNAWEENIALTNEAELRYNTVASQLQILKNVINDVAISIGEELLPHIKTLIENIRNADFTPVINAFKWIIANGKIIISTIVTIGAGMMAWNVANTIMGVVTAIKIWTGAIQAAAAAQAGLNIVMAANPIGAVVTVLAALTAGLVTYKAMAGQTANETNKLSQEIDNLRTSYEENKKAIEENETKSILQMETASKLKDELYELERQVLTGKLSDEEAAKTKEKMQSILSQLRKILPDLKLEIDKETGALSAQIGTVEQLIDSYIRLAQAKAAAAKLEEAEKAILDARVKQRQAQDAAVDPQKRVDRYSAELANRSDLNYFLDGSPENYSARALLVEAQKELAPLIQAEKEAAKIIAERQKDIETVTKIIKEQGVEIDKVNQKTNELGDAFNETSVAGVSGASGTAKAQKDLTKTMESELEQRRKDLKYNLDMNYITEKDYYDGLETLRDTYFAEGTEEWRKYTVEIYNFNKKQFEAIKKDIDSTFKAISDSAQKEFNEIESKRNALESRLHSTAVLFQDIEIKGLVDGDMKFTRANLDGLKKDIRELAEYSEVLAEVEKVGEGSPLYNFFLQMSTEDAVKNFNAFKKLTQAEQNEYISLLTQRQELATKVSKNAYQTELDNFNKNYAKQILETLSDMTGQYADLGKDYALAIGEGFKSAIQDVFRNMSNDINVNMGRVAMVSGSTVNSTYSPTVVMQGGGSIAQSLAAASKQYLIDKTRGLIK